ncbi:MAG: hypothetical protein ACRDHD_11810, partial [Candidatus Limnocylindria bacterium]
MYDIVGKRRWYFLFSALITVPGLVFIALGGLKPSVDFTGGTVWQVRYADAPTAVEVQAALVELGHPEASVRELDDGYLEIRTNPIGLLPPQTPIPSVSLAPSLSASPTASPSPSPTPAETPDGSPIPTDVTPTPTPTASPSPTPTATASPTASPTATPSPTPQPVVAGTEFADVQEALVARFGEAEDGRPRSVTTVGPLIGSELIRTSIILIVVGELFILGYLWIRFGFRFGTAAIVALLHDVIVVVGIFAILGYFFEVEFDALF